MSDYIKIREGRIARIKGLIEVAKKLCNESIGDDRLDADIVRTALSCYADKLHSEICEANKLLAPWGKGKGISVPVTGWGTTDALKDMQYQINKMTSDMITGTANVNITGDGKPGHPNESIDYNGITVTAGSGEYIFSLPGQFQVAVPNKGCAHVWKSYVGLTASFEYCEKCDEKKV